jgi:predicted AlkP superfamily phosphohydrolase/phosphomutase
MTGIHKLNGVLIAAGGPILPGVRFETQPTIADVTPTVLALMGLPVARDMSGRVLTEMIDPEFLARHPVQTIAS